MIHTVLIVTSLLFVGAESEPAKPSSAAESSRTEDEIHAASEADPDVRESDPRGSVREYFRLDARRPAGSDRGGVRLSERGQIRQRTAYAVEEGNLGMAGGA